MNSKLEEINIIISLCDRMISYINKKGIITTGNSEYENYKERIRDFFQSHNELPRDYGPFLVLDKLHFTGRGYTVCMSEAQMIRNTVIWMKHDLYPEYYDKIFISHREKDKGQVDALIDLLYAIGIPRPKESDTEKIIFCTSHPDAYIENGANNLDEIKKYFKGSDHVYYILWYTNAYFESQACLNEAGAIWATDKTYQEILSPTLDSAKIGGLLDKQPVWFRANDKYRLNTFKEQVEKMFCLPRLTTNAWELARDKYIKQLNS